MTLQRNPLKTSYISRQRCSKIRGRKLCDVREAVISLKGRDRERGEREREREGERSAMKKRFYVGFIG